MERLNTSGNELRDIGEKKEALVPPARVLDGAIVHEAGDGMVLVPNLPFSSICERHLVPFHGRAHIAYLPRGRVIEPARLPRLLDAFAHRLQLQERLTDQVARAIQLAIQPRGVAVRLEAAHECMLMRGVERRPSLTFTSSFLGAFERDLRLRRDFGSGAVPGGTAPSPAGGVVGNAPTADSPGGIVPRFCAD
jgi:GTP cyclohydrolase I